jgi:hypothetical protein
MTNLQVVLVALALLTSIGVADAQHAYPSPTPTTGAPTRRPDDRRPMDQLTLRLLNRPLTIGGELENTCNTRGILPSATARMMFCASVRSWCSSSLIP